MEIISPELEKAIAEDAGKYLPVILTLSVEKPQFKVSRAVGGARSLSLLKDVSAMEVEAARWRAAERLEFISNEKPEWFPVAQAFFMKMIPAQVYEAAHTGLFSEIALDRAIRAHFRE